MISLRLGIISEVLDYSPDALLLIEKVVLGCLVLLFFVNIDDNTDEHVVEEHPEEDYGADDEQSDEVVHLVLRLHVYANLV